MILPHDRSCFFSTPQYWDAVFTFFENELHNDGEDMTSLSLFDTSSTATAHIIAKQSGILSGKEEAEFLLSKFFPYSTITFFLTDGAYFEKNTIVCTLGGSVREMMKVERVLVNLLSRMSGIATKTQSLVSISRTALAATRKTQWGYLDKKAVFTAKGFTHRMGLFDAILVKENHSIAFGNGKKDIWSVLTHLKNTIPTTASFIEVEVETISECEMVYHFFRDNGISFPTVIMLDNFTPEDIIQTLSILDTIAVRHTHSIFIEVSGGITEDTLSLYDSLGADVISMGALTHSVLPIDFSMRVAE